MTVKIAPTASSSYKDASSSSGEEEETNYESDSKLVEASSKPNSLSEVVTDSPVVKPPAYSSSKLEANSSSEEEETDSESEMEEPPGVADPNVAETSKPSSSAVKPPADSNNVKISQKHVTKKRSTETDEGEAKRVKMDGTKSSGQETKKNYFQRVWTEQDEITILQGMIDYQNETGSNLFDDKNALYDLLKNSVGINPSKTQLFEKIRALKNKYGNNLGKEKKRAFSKPHGLEAFRLSRLVWANDGNATEVELPVLKLVGPAAKKLEFVPVVESLARFGVDDLFAKNGWSKISLEDKKRHEKECVAA